MLIKKIQFVNKESKENSNKSDSVNTGNSCDQSQGAVAIQDQIEKPALSQPISDLSTTNLVEKQADQKILGLTRDKDIRDSHDTPHRKKKSSKNNLNDARDDVELFRDVESIATLVELMARKNDVTKVLSKEQSIVKEEPLPRESYANGSESNVTNSDTSTKAVLNKESSSILNSIWKNAFSSYESMILKPRKQN